jgi:hypothetical protein
VNRQPRDHGIDDHGGPGALGPEIRPAPHPVSRPVLQGHVLLRHGPR